MKGMCMRGGVEGEKRRLKAYDSESWIPDLAAKIGNMFFIWQE